MLTLNVRTPHRFCVHVQAPAAAGGAGSPTAGVDPPPVTDAGQANGESGEQVLAHVLAQAALLTKSSYSRRMHCQTLLIDI